MVDIEIVHTFAAIAESTLSDRLMLRINTATSLLFLKRFTIDFDVKKPTQSNILLIV